MSEELAKIRGQKEQIKLMAYKKAVVFLGLPTENDEAYPDVMEFINLLVSAASLEVAELNLQAREDRPRIVSPH